MPQIFPESANRVPLLVLAVVAVVGLVVPALVWYYFSPEYTDVGYRPEQPVPYSHALHAGELEIDCRYCHAQVERAAVASVPPTTVCMNCHSLVKRDSDQLAVIRESISRQRPVRWVRVHMLPDYAFFDHGAHVRAGVGCSSCHGDVMAMEVVTQAETLSMRWCLDCHRDPGPHLRDLDQVTNTRWQPPRDQAERAAALVAERAVAPPEDCTGCHR